jgi:diguanylate cyclase (GGDEF)-like protein
VSIKNIDTLAKDELVKELKMLSAEHSALLDSARAILHNLDFETSAQEIFNYCKKVTGATSGYVALLSSDGSENEVLFLDSGERVCTVNEDLPMPIRGLRETAYRTLKGVFDNSFADSKWMQYLPKGHMRLDNVLFAPLIIEQQAVGLIGMANKENGFTQRDIGFVEALSDIAAVALRNSRNLETLRYLSFHDQLTGLYNRHYFENEIKRLDLSREHPITVISADLDNLKMINDSRGHAEGDLYLQACATLFKETLRGYDLLARIGGDEFALVLTRTDRNTGEDIMKRINNNVEKYNQTDKALPLSISMGIAVSESASQPLEDTLRDADGMMYKDKLQRRKQNYQVQ